MIPAWLFAAALIGQAAVFMTVVAWLLRTHARERAELLNRLMARDLSEYQAVASAPARDTSLRHNPIAIHRERQRQAAQPLDQ